MKRLLLLFLLFICAFTLVSCNEEDTNTDSNSQPSEEDTNTDSNSQPSEEDYIEVSIADAIMMADAVGENLTEINLCVTGVISSISNAEYGNMKITDGVNTIGVYGLYDKNNTPYRDLSDKPVKGDTIKIYGKVHSFNGEAEFKNAIIVSFTHVDIELDNTYVSKTIAEARNLEKGSQVIIEGVVARITYADKMIPNGFYVVDSTGSIYVYGEEAQQVSVGNTVKIAGTKDYFIAENEITNALKYGYQGSCQLKNAYILENNATNSSFEKGWIEETTVKKIIETPLSNNITTNIYKVNVLIKKVVQPGYTNYYIDDIDGETGSYVYTANNGSDFAWLDEFDGKICTVYLSAINCKSTASGCVYRLIPILVSNDNYKFDIGKAAEYAIEYKAYDQFKTVYDSDPAMEVITEVSSELLGFSGVTVEYSSSNNDVIYFEEADGKTTMHTKDVGKATVTITARHNGKQSSKTIEITVNEEKQFDTITIAEAIASADNTEVTVKGVVVSSLVNQTGFYISDETGIISVTCSSELLNEITIGNEIVIKGIRIHKKKTPTHNSTGQSVISDANLLANYYGTHEYDTSKFVTDKTISDLYNLKVTTDYSTTVYVVTGVIKYYKDTYSSGYNIYSADGTVYFGLYSGNETQYSWLNACCDKEVVIELAACNWNSKNYYRGCIISITYNGEKVINTLNFTK